jgi:hypothetical protein
MHVPNAMAADVTVLGAGVKGDEFGNDGKCLRNIGI